MSEKMSLNQKIKKLDSDVEWFYSEDFELDNAAKKYKEAMELANDIKHDLNELKNEIMVLTEDFTK